MEAIEVNGLEVWAFHGVGEQERRVGNMFVVDVRLDVDLGRAMESDRVDDTVNYEAVVEVVKREMSVPSNLLENVVWRIREAIKREFACVLGGRVRLAKLTPPITCKVDSVAVVTRW